MKRDQKAVSKDLAFGILFFLGGLICWWNIQSLEESRFDSLGNDFFPGIASGGLMLLALLLIIKALYEMRALRNKPENNIEKKEPFNWQNIILLPCISFILTVGYAFSLEYEIGNFRVNSTIYLLVCGIVLAKGKLRAIPGITICALIVSNAIYYSFTRLFLVPLP